jgi:hypothetical protein
MLEKQGTFKPISPLFKGGREDPQVSNITTYTFSNTLLAKVHTYLSLLTLPEAQIATPLFFSSLQLGRKERIGNSPSLTVGRRDWGMRAIVWLFRHPSKLGGWPGYFRERIRA